MNFGQRWRRFWFTPIDPAGLHVVRLGAGLLFFFWLLAFAGHQSEFFGLQGWFDRKAFSEAVRQNENLPEPITWSLLYFLGGNSTLIDGIYILALVVTGLFALGVATRLTAPLTWLVVLSFVCNPAISYDADHLLILLAFYLMIGYLLHGLWNGPRTWANRLLGSCDALAWKLWPSVRVRSNPAPPSIGANLTLRLLQVHFAIVVFASGLHKLQFGDWWAGLAFWYPLHPPMSTTAEQVRAEMGRASVWLFGLSLAQYLLLAWQLAFPFLAWRPNWRAVLLGGALIGWVGSVWLYGLPLFGPVLFLACLSYLTPEEWLRVEKVLLRILQSRDLEAHAGQLGGQRS
jgi:hypothetical protein